MTREENLIYRRSCPYDAMGDYSILMEENQDRVKNLEEKRNRTEPEKDPIRQYRKVHRRRDNLAAEGVSGYR